MRFILSLLVRRLPVEWYWYVLAGLYALFHLGCALVAYIVLEDLFEAYGSKRYLSIGIASLIGGPVTIAASSCVMMIGGGGGPDYG